ncbi:sensor histidine kinase [Novosphingobium subterraneum]|uniref:histidine kinase n=1 Tax=Novosphingobium subterraneum TaxID=48936 RepID=A0A0B9ABD4_9SPHN|nr:histidine kinase dimerization/phosphoacceptor domain -containing protein [Novosphingobium subterraneum]KHS46650.1 signal transduction histidine kinase [Novosphingobium subterraneum]
MSKVSSSSPAAAESLALALIHSSRAPVLLINSNLQIVGASNSFCNAFGYQPDNLAGCDLDKLGEGEWGLPQLRSLLRSTLHGSASVDAYEMDLVRSDHAMARLVLNAHLLDYDEDVALIVLTISDVTSALLAEKIKDDLIKEKQVLLIELQHRVANSLQIIASVLMQSARRVQSEETRLHLRNAHNRVLSIATLQKQLAVSSEDQVHLREYFAGLCESIGASMIDEEDRITLKSTTDDSFATANVATSLGLIVTELVINSLKHAFPNHAKSGAIAVDYHAEGAAFTLTVSDDGVGIANSEEPIAPGLGTGIVDALAKNLGATVVTTQATPGTRIAIVRPE